MRAVITCLAVTVLAVCLSASVAVAQGTPQQERMKTCNADATGKGLSGDARKSFMRGCLKGRSEQVSQQDKMKACNADATAKKLSGDARKSFMSGCLKK